MVKSMHIFMYFIVTNIALIIPLTPQKICHKENVKFSKSIPTYKLLAVVRVDVWNYKLPHIDGS